MHLIETYALNCGLKIDKPFIYEKYCPIPFDKYISFQPCSKYSSKSYDLWQEVIDQIVPILQEDEIHVVQIGGKDEKPIKNCYHLQGKTNINQAAYIIKRGLLHFGAVLEFILLVVMINLSLRSILIAGQRTLVHILVQKTMLRY